jgi:hypothetical protein
MIVAKCGSVAIAANRRLEDGGDRPNGSSVCAGEFDSNVMVNVSLV